jgi:hypothetical protein
VQEFNELDDTGAHRHARARARVSYIIQPQVLAVHAAVPRPQPSASHCPLRAAAGKAEVLALAKRMLRRKDKESILEAAYNRCGYSMDMTAQQMERHPLMRVCFACLLASYVCVCVCTCSSG